LMLMCHSLIGGQKPLGFCQCRIEVILIWLNVHFFVNIFHKHTFGIQIPLT